MSAEATERCPSAPSPPPPGEIHVGLRHDQPHALRLRPADDRLPPLLLHRDAKTARELAHAGEAQVVARVRVLRLGIAEPDDQPLLAILLLLLLFHADTS